MKIEFDDDRMNRLVAMVVAAGKSPATDHNVMLAASEMLQWLQAKIAEAKAPKEDVRPNGHVETAHS